MTNRYVYGVVSRADAVEFETDAVAGADRVYPVSGRRLAALVSNVDTTDVERTDEDASRHDRVLREIMQHGDGRTVIPMQFGMVFESDRALKNVLRGAAPAFRQAMSDVEGRIELGVKVVRDQGTTVDREAVVDEVSDALAPLAVETVENGLFSDRLVVNRSYLVDHERRERFDDAVAALEAAREELTVRYTGPFAPYSFVDIHVGGQ